MIRRGGWVVGRFPICRLCAGGSWETPRVFYMHVHGRGTPADLARRVKTVLDLIGHISSGSAPRRVGETKKASAPRKAETAQAQIDTARVARIIGHQDEQTGCVYKITIGRDDLNLTEMGAAINARMGLNTWAAFVGTDENAAVAGDVAMLENEVTPVLKALRTNGLEVVAIHHHMIEARPMIIFLHYWAKGSAEKLATGFKAALDELGKGRSATKLERQG